MKTFRTLMTWLIVIVSLSMTSCSNNDDEDGGADSASMSPLRKVPLS